MNINFGFITITRYNIVFPRMFEKYHLLDITSYMMQELLEGIRERPRFLPLLFQFFPENFLAPLPDRATSSFRILRVYSGPLFEIVYNYICPGIMQCFFSSPIIT